MSNIRSTDYYPTLCKCCGEVKPDVKVRLAGPRSAATSPLCDACWNDPSSRYADCKHGKEAK